MKRDIENLFEGDERTRLWAHIAALHKRAKGKAAEIKERQSDPYQRQTLNHERESWLRVAGALKVAASTIAGI